MQRFSTAETIGQIDLRTFDEIVIDPDLVMRGTIKASEDGWQYDEASYRLRAVAAPLVAQFVEYSDDVFGSRPYSFEKIEIVPIGSISVVVLHKDTLQSNQLAVMAANFRPTTFLDRSQLPGSIYVFSKDTLHHQPYVSSPADRKAILMIAEFDTSVTKVFGERNDSEVSYEVYDEFIKNLRVVK